MKFLYKIYSGYDGFTPRRIPERMLPDNLLQLSWTQYLGAVEEGREVWVYFHGPHVFENGVYVKGFIQSIDIQAQCVYLRVREHATDTPLTDPETTNRVAKVVAPKFRQVFLLPEEWAPSPDCTAESCKARKCESCPRWKGLLLIAPDSHGWPPRLPRAFKGFAPAYWVVPSRCYLGRRVGRLVRRTTELFYRFKLGDQALAFPLALGMFEALRQRKLLDFDGIVPIPLSPDKAAAGEVHRTRLLAGELARLLATRVADVLTLKEPISKRRALLAGGTSTEFDHLYFDALSVRAEVKTLQRILLVDDVCTKGSTLRNALYRIRMAHRGECEFFATTAGQMVLRAVVRNEEPLLSS